MIIVDYLQNDNALDCPLLQNDPDAKFNIPTNKKIDRQLILGSALFGVGWGIGNLCHATALYLAANGYHQILRCWWPNMILGSYLGEKAKKYV